MELGQNIHLSVEQLEKILENIKEAYEASQADDFLESVFHDDGKVCNWNKEQLTNFLIGMGIQIGYTPPQWILDRFWNEANTCNKDTINYYQFLTEMRFALKRDINDFGALLEQANKA